VVGVGGQGIVLASDIVSEVALAAGYDVKKTDALGMAQRGGSVVSHVRMAGHVWSPLIKEGEADMLVAFEKLEASRWAYYLRPGGIAIVNDYAVPPLSVSLGTYRYPDDKGVADILKRQTDRVYFADGAARARELGDARTVNMFMLGFVSSFLPIDVRLWMDCISQRLASGIRQMNAVAFDLGRKETSNVHLG